MIESVFLAKLIGIYLLIAGIALLNRKNIDLLFSIYRHKESVFLTGIVDLLFGLLIVLTHNVWVWSWQGVITFIGWMLLARGIGRAFFPEKVAANVTRMQKSLGKNTTLIYLLLFVVLAVGAWLTYIGFSQ